MPKVKISEYSATANSNTDVASINIDEGCAPSGINNAIRAVMGHLKDFQQGTYGDPFNGPHNGTVGATTPSTGAFTTLSATGNVTLGDASTDTLNVGNGGLIKDASGNVGIGNTSPASYNSAADNLVIGTSGSNGMTIVSGSTSSGYIMFADGTTGQQAYEGQITYDHTNNFMAFNTSGTERMRIASDTGGVGAVGIGYTSLTSVGNNGLAVLGNVGIGTSSPLSKLQISTSGNTVTDTTSTGTGYVVTRYNTSTNYFFTGINDGANTSFPSAAYANLVWGTGAYPIVFATNNGEKMRLDSSGNLLVGGTTLDIQANMLYWNRGGGTAGHLALGNTEATNVTALIYCNRQGSDGTLVEFRQANITEGSISVSGTTVTYGGGHLARFGQLPDGSEDPTLLKGTVLTNLDEMCVWINKETGIPADNEQCNKVKISDVDGDANVAGVFVSWSYDEQHDTNDLFVAMTGDMIIRIAQGVTVARGDLLMSAGDGTAKPQGDDIVRSKTVAKVTSTHVTCTYEDGSYCVPCVLMAC